MTKQEFIIQYTLRRVSDISDKRYIPLSIVEEAADFWDKIQAESRLTPTKFIPAGMMKAIFK